MNLARFKLSHQTTALTPLFLNESGRSIGVSLLSFFSAIYIYKKVFGETGDSVLAMIMAFSFFALLNFFKIVGTFLSESQALKWGLKKQVIIGNLLTIVSLVFFYLSEENLGFLFPASIVWGLGIGYFWFGWHGLLAKIGHDGVYGEAIGWSGIVNSLFGMTVPILGGFLIANFGYGTLFLATLLILMISLIPLLALEDRQTHHVTTFGEIFKLLVIHRKMSFVYFALGACGTVYSLALILYIFFFLGQEFAFGEFFSLSLLLVALVNFGIGKWTDKNGKRGLLAYGAYFGAFVWLGRLLATTAPVLLIFDVIDRIAGGMVGIPMMVLTYEKTRSGHSTARALVFREVALALGAISAALILIVLTLLGLPIKSMFLVAACFSLAPLLIAKHHLFAYPASHEPKK